jgi:hypothetical protein
MHIVTILCLIISKTARLRKKRTEHINRVSCFSAVFVRNIFRSHKYLASYVRDARRSECRSSYRVSVTFAPF